MGWRGTYTFQEFFFRMVVHQSSRDTRRTLRLLLLALFRCRCSVTRSSIRHCADRRRSMTHLFDWASAMSMSSSAPSNLYTLEIKR